MKVEKRKDNGFILTAETEGDTPEQEFLDFIGGIVNKVRKDINNGVWGVESFDGKSWSPILFFTTRREARASARMEGRGPCRVKRYVRI